MDHPLDHPIRIAARAIDDVLKSVADVNPSFMATSDKAAALVELARLESRVAELRLRVAADASDVADLRGARDVGVWAAVETRRRSTCVSELRLADALAVRPVLAAGVREGTVNLDQARVIAASLDALPPETPTSVVDQAEEALVAYAAEFDPTELARLGRRILEIIAPDAYDALEARHLADLEASARHRMRLRLRSCGDGTTRLTGLIPDADAARLATYLHSFANPRRPDTEGEEISEKDAVRRAPYGRRAARAFCELLETLDPAGSRSTAATRPP